MLGAGCWGLGAGCWLLDAKSGKNKQQITNNKKNCGRSRVQRFRGSRFHSCPRTAFGMRIYEKSVSFVRPNQKFEGKLAITWENEHL